MSFGLLLYNTHIISQLYTRTPRGVYLHQPANMTNNVIAAEAEQMSSVAVHFFPEFGSVGIIKIVEKLEGHGLSQIITDCTDRVGHIREGAGCWRRAQGTEK